MPIENNFIPVESNHHFDLDHCNQTKELKHQIKEKMYGKLNSLAEKPWKVRVLAVPTAVASSAISIVMNVMNVGENLLKGTINVVGAPFSKKCSLLMGSAWLLSIPFRLVYLAGSTLVHTPIRIVLISVGLSAFPKKVAEELAYLHKGGSYQEWVEDLIAACLFVKNGRLKTIIKNAHVEPVEKDQRRTRTVSIITPHLALPASSV